MRTWGLVLAVVALSLAACGDPVDEGTSDVKIDPNFTSIQKNLFDLRCISCHGAGRQGDLDLRAGNSYAELVNVTPNLPAAAQTPGLKRVTPGDVAKSFLYLKLKGPGDLGKRMPVRGDLLTSEQLGAIRTWIENGAEK